MPYSKNTIKVKVQSRSGFDKSHRNTGTSHVGTLVPLLCDELIPNSRVSLRLPISVQLPPLVSDTYMNLRYEVQAFFVPSRLLCKSFESFFCDVPQRVYASREQAGGATYSGFEDVPGRIPYFVGSGSAPFVNTFGPGSLADFLGLRTNDAISIGGSVKVNPLPFAAYHLVWQEWYRNPRVQNPAFAPRIGTGVNALGNSVAFMPFTFYHDTLTSSPTAGVESNLVLADAGTLADGTSIFSLRQRNFDQDYFTGARVSAQQGNVARVTFDTSGSEGEMTIAALRAANSLQQFRERNNIPSQRLIDQVKARYGANLSDGVAQRPICIGSSSFDVYTRGIDQNAPSPENSAHLNPFSGVAAQYGRAAAGGNDFIIDDFTANEPGYLLVLGSLVPEVTYTYGLSPMFFRYTEKGSIVQMACSLLQNVGDQPIYNDEFTGVVQVNPQDRAVFGYTDRFADFMFIPNQLHGEMREGRSLGSFVLQRSIAGTSTLSSAFLTIPESYLDGVIAVADDYGDFSYWYDAILQYRVSMPLAEYSLPSLQDPAYEHGQTITLRRNGQIF